MANKETIFQIARFFLACREKNGLLKHVIEGENACKDLTDGYGLSGLHQAVMHHNFLAVKFLIEKAGWAVDKSSPLGVTPLHLAAEQGYHELVKYLLDKGADINAVNNNNYMPIHLAIEQENYNSFAILCHRGANLNHFSPSGTPLHIAVTWKLIEYVKLLVERWAHLNSLDYLCRTPLYLAVGGGSHDIVRLLLKAGANPNRPVLPLDDVQGFKEYILPFESIEQVPYIDLDVQDGPCHAFAPLPLHLAAAEQDAAMIQLLLDYGANNKAIDLDCLKPVHVAAKFGRVDIVGLLFRKPDKYGIFGGLNSAGLVSSLTENGPTLVKLANNNTALIQRFSRCGDKFLEHNYFMKALFFYNQAYTRHKDKSLLSAIKLLVRMGRCFVGFFNETSAVANAQTAVAALELYSEALQDDEWRALKGGAYELWGTALDLVMQCEEACEKYLNATIACPCETHNTLYQLSQERLGVMEARRNAALGNIS